MIVLKGIKVPTFGLGSMLSETTVRFRKMKEHEHPHQPGKKRVLCVEGNQDNAFVMSRLLQFEGYDCVSVSTVVEGLQLARVGRFDLYLLDSWYQDGTGVELCREIRKFDSIKPVLFYTGLDLKSARVEAQVAGAQAYIVMPNFEALMPTIAHYIEESHEMTCFTFGGNE